MASTTIPSPVTPIERGGTGATDWKTAANTLGFLAGNVTSGVDTNFDTALDTVMKGRTNDNYNTDLATAIESNFAYVIQIYYFDGPAERTATSTRLQIAFPYRNSDTKIAWRTYVNGWGSWHVVSAT